MEEAFATAKETKRADQQGSSTATGDLAVIDDLMAAGQMLATQQPSASSWSPEKRLAAAVLASALVEIRDHRANRSYGRRIDEDLEWIGSTDTVWPFSFVRLCQLFDLDPSWVRAVVARWLERPAGTGRSGTPYRQAA